MTFHQQHPIRRQKSIQFLGFFISIEHRHREETELHERVLPWAKATLSSIRLRGSQSVVFPRPRRCARRIAVSGLLRTLRLAPRTRSAHDPLPELGTAEAQVVIRNEGSERSERIGALGAGFLSPTRPLIIVVFRHSPSQGERPCRANTQPTATSSRRPHSNRGWPRGDPGRDPGRPAADRNQTPRWAHPIRTAEDFKSLEGARSAALTNRLSALLMAEATQVALTTRRTAQASSLAQGAGPHDQGSRPTRRHAPDDVRPGSSSRATYYFSRNCDRSKASKGMYPMLLLWGVHDRCTAAIVSEISKLAMLSSLEEVEQVLSDRGATAGLQDHSDDAYRFATRARAAQRVGA